MIFRAATEFGQRFRVRDCFMNQPTLYSRNFRHNRRKKTESHVENLSQFLTHLDDKPNKKKACAPFVKLSRPQGKRALQFEKQRGNTFIQRVLHLFPRCRLSVADHSTWQLYGRSASKRKEEQCLLLVYGMEKPLYVTTKNCERHRREPVRVVDVEGIGMEGIVFSPDITPYAIKKRINHLISSLVKMNNGTNIMNYLLHGDDYEKRRLTPCVEVLSYTYSAMDASTVALPWKEKF
ncbi:hypothetical protein TNCV_4803501 [Trichonephila clavipes]|nr:hypothetical protein TNCV_4803501 [Trichonephila clavipes]